MALIPFANESGSWFGMGEAYARGAQLSVVTSRRYLSVASITLVLEDKGEEESGVVTEPEAAG